MDATRRRRTLDETRRAWYAYRRSIRFSARFGLRPGLVVVRVNPDGSPATTPIVWKRKQ